METLGDTRIGTTMKFDYLIWLGIRDISANGLLLCKFIKAIDILTEQKTWRKFHDLSFSDFLVTPPPSKCILIMCRFILLRVEIVVLLGIQTFKEKWMLNVLIIPANIGMVKRTSSYFIFENLWVVRTPFSLLLFQCSSTTCACFITRWTHSWSQSITYSRQAWQREW